jgi:hypothetical protein
MAGLVLYCEIALQVDGGLDIIEGSSPLVAVDIPEEPIVAVGLGGDVVHGVVDEVGLSVVDIAAYITDLEYEIVFLVLLS